ncbi:LanM family lanthionine synthetase (plasmid) [Halobiforma lacisalsi AJ5]|uniref:LanM family lanthionine synthetase n=1 Tax=Natronobacterium lacisalsi AJ5 TaxID=358396 RepID=M0LDN7_NATLA|nr:type 2 lanthipeptide synthetase LanM family protein [Halobiforma lacisalsi]APX00245.1 LanM family lanthionine synthetase [Halobiforma lacisalsi AJ5]EMA30060.1 lantibiotic modifying enzyme [Halobiforma lacisalsi AJ5]
MSKTESGVFSDEHKRLIVGRAQTLLERIDAGDSLEPSGLSEDENEEIFEEWEELFPSEEAFERRLEREGITKAECEDAIASDKLAEDEPLPEWIEQVENLAAWILAGDPDDYRAPSTAADEPDSGDTDERPFPELSAAVGAYTRTRLADERVGKILSETAIEEMTSWFQIRFEERFIRILFVEFKTFTAAHDEDRAFADADDFEELPTEYYERFIEYLFTGGFVDLCQEYPMFARLVAVQIQQWVAHLEEFCERLEADRERLRERFSDGHSLGPVTDLKPLADDTHGDGRAIMRVEFDSGVTVVYKPRSVDAGETFYRVLDRIEDHLPLPDFKRPNYLCRDGYGWMEWIESAECPDESAVERYYKRAGSLLCIGYFLEFTDCQFENLIVSGEYPVLVDAETILHPYIIPDRKPTATGTSAVTDDSVLLTLLLPYSIENLASEDAPGDMPSRISGFSVASDPTDLEGVEYSVIKWPNTDVMSVERETASADRSENIPKVDSTDHPPEEYIDEIVDGFETTYETVLELRDDGRLSDEIGMPNAFETIENRLVYRPTMRYTAVIKSLSSRKNLHNGANFGATIDALSVPLCTEQVSKPRPWHLYEAERAAIKRLDPPRITSQPDATEIQRNGENLGVKVDASGMDRSRKRIEAATRADMRKQIEFIRGCFGKSPDPTRRDSVVSVTEAAQANDDQLLTEATDLFEQTKDAAFEATSGVYHWGSIAPKNETERLTVRPANESLYSGRIGIALFGAALYRVTDEQRYREFVLDTIDPIYDAITSKTGTATLYNHGACSGIGSVAYGLSTISDLLSDESVLENSVRLVENFPDEQYQDDTMYDVAAGSAGTILGTLKLYERTGDGELLSAAEKCGDHLLESRVETEGNVRTWKSFDDSPPLTGYAHGASGIAYALIRLADVTGTEAYADAALEALEYESETYSEAAGNWPDLRSWTNNDFLDQWCYGRSGIGLARLGMSEYVTDDRVTRGIERAVDGMPAGEIDELDHLCCGEAGRAEFLLEVERRLGKRRGEARAAIGTVLERKRRNGTYRTTAHTRQIPNPTFFHGVSGIGYTLLRILEPDALPSVLLWE